MQTLSKHAPRAIAVLSFVILVTGCPSGSGITLLPGTVTVVYDLPDLAAMNAGSNAVDSQNQNRAVSNLLVLDANGAAEKTLVDDGEEVVFSGGETLTVYANVWFGPQSDNDYRFRDMRTIVVDGNMIVEFGAEDNDL